MKYLMALAVAFLCGCGSPELPAAEDAPADRGVMVADGTPASVADEVPDTDGVVELAGLLDRDTVHRRVAKELEPYWSLYCTFVIVYTECYNDVCQVFVKKHCP